MPVSICTTQMGVKPLASPVRPPLHPDSGSFNPDTLAGQAVDLPTPPSPTLATDNNSVEA